MSRSLSATFREAVYAQETDEAFLVLIELDHDDWDAPVRVTSDGVDTSHGGNTYVAYPFEIILPDDTEESVTHGQLIVDNVSRDMIANIRSIASPPTVTITVVLASDPDTIEAQFTDFHLTSISYDAYKITGDLTIETFMQEPFPGDDFIPTYFPGLF